MKFIFGCTERWKKSIVIQKSAQTAASNVCWNSMNACAIARRAWNRCPVGTSSWKATWSRFRHAFCRIRNWCSATIESKHFRLVFPLSSNPIRHKHHSNTQIDQSPYTHTNFPQSCNGCFRWLDARVPEQFNVIVGGAEALVCHHNGTSKTCHGWFNRFVGTSCQRHANGYWQTKNVSALNEQVANLFQLQSL